MLRIGNVDLATNLLLSPIAGYCDLAFRLTIRPLGGLGLASTALINPLGLLRQTDRSMELVSSAPGDDPLCIQLYGHNPHDMAEATRWCRDRGAVMFDINMGCPVDKVCKRDGGAALMRDPKLALRLAESVVNAAHAPVTVKMRLGWDDESVIAADLARSFEDIGVAAVIVHGRTAEQRFRGDVRLDGIARVVESVRSIPVIGNGDVCSPADAAEMMRRTGCAGVMIGRRALRDPWIFRDTHAWLTTGRVPPPPRVADRIAFMNRHFENLLEHRGERLACVTFRQRVTWYAKELPPCRPFCDRVRHIHHAHEYWDAVDSLRAALDVESARSCPAHV